MSIPVDSENSCDARIVVWLMVVVADSCCEW